MAAAPAPSSQSTAPLPSPGGRATRHQGQSRGPGRRANAPSLRAPVRSTTREPLALHLASGSRAEKGCSPPLGGAQPDKAGTDRGRASELNAFRKIPPPASATLGSCPWVGDRLQLSQPAVRENRVLDAGLWRTLWSTRGFKNRNLFH